MNYTEEEFYKDVAREAELLRDNATEEEKNLLSFRKLEPQRFGGCIYGQMTGDCRNSRAVKLIALCCPRFIKNPMKRRWDDFSVVKANVNGTERSCVTGRRRTASIEYFSSIESYILLPTAKNYNLIDYIKGKTEKLVL